MRAGFWFDGVTFELPARETSRIGGQIRDEEKARIQDIARAALADAYAGLRISFTSDPHAFYRVAVVQELRGRPFGTRSPIGGVAGESRSLGPLGGQGAVSFLTLATNAVYYAPPDADRATIIRGIGRGLGRAAAHELAHQVVGGTADLAHDRDCYDYGNADRASQYYGTLHWNGAWHALVKKLGQ